MLALYYSVSFDYTLLQRPPLSRHFSRSWEFGCVGPQVWGMDIAIYLVKTKYTHISYSLQMASSV